MSLAHAMQRMHMAVDDAEKQLSHHMSGCVRFEVSCLKHAPGCSDGRLPVLGISRHLFITLASAVMMDDSMQIPVPRDASALQWLQGQPQHSSLQPRIYFSPRASSAPSTPGGNRAEAGMLGSGAVAGASPLPAS